MYHWRQSWRTRVVNNTVYQFVSFDLGVEILLKKREHQKRVRWNTRLRLLCTLCIGVSRKFHLHFTLMFYLRYDKMVQSLYKNWLLVSKITRGIWKYLDKQAVDSPKSWNLMGYFCPKYTCLQLKHNAQDLSKVLSTTCVKIHFITIFETISHFSRHNSSLSFSLKHYILSTKVSHQSANFQTFHCSG